MAKLLTAEQAIVKIAKKVRRVRKFYAELPEFGDDRLEEIVEYVEGVVRRCSAVPKKLRKELDDGPTCY
jgi:hypothetical protein